MRSGLLWSPNPGYFLQLSWSAFQDGEAPKVSPINLGRWTRVQELSSNMGTARMRISPFSVTFPPHIFKRFTQKPVLSLVATPGAGGVPSPASSSGVGPESAGWAAEAGRWGGLAPRMASPGRQAHPHTHCPASDALRCALQRGDTKQLPNTALQGLKMQHPKQGLKMQSRGGPVRRVGVQTAAAAKAASSPFPPQSPGGRSD